MEMTNKVFNDRLNKCENIFSICFETLVKIYSQSAGYDDDDDDVVSRSCRNLTHVLNFHKLYVYIDQIHAGKTKFLK